MAKAYSNDLRERVVAAMQSGESCRRVAARSGVAPSTAVKWTDRARRTGSVSPAKMGGYCRPLLEPHRDWLLEQVRDCPHVTLAVLQDLLAERGVVVSHDTVWRFLRGCRFSFKKKDAGRPPRQIWKCQIACRAMDQRERPDVKRRRERWQRYQGRVDPRRLVFIDET